MGVFEEGGREGGRLVKKKNWFVMFWKLDFVGFMEINILWGWFVWVNWWKNIVML